MILIKNIEFLETDEDPVKLLHRTPPHLPVQLGREYIKQDCLVEMIRGRRFIRPSDGTELIIGVSKQAQEVLGLQYAAWDNLQAAYEAQRHANSRVTNEMYGYKSRLEGLLTATFWQRLMWLITGVK